MPRKTRIFMAGMPCHVIQRGNNRSACFYADDDYLFYLDALADACQRFHVALHAYVLMTNHAHFLMSPQDETGIPLVMQSLGRRYVQYVNKTYRRSGTLWEGRYKSSLVDAENYLFACYRYIELNPVAAGMVAHPGDYRWSSYCANAGGREDALVTPHERYLWLGKNREERAASYRELFAVALPKNIVHDIRIASTFSAPLGNSRFREEIEMATGMKVVRTKRGRPEKGVRDKRE
ncbi:MAG TPA: transposase [Pseudomonadales bacterium]|nr:transposase [Pseudomonadales bacterium]